MPTNFQSTHSTIATGELIKQTAKVIDFLKQVAEFIALTIMNIDDAFYCGELLESLHNEPQISETVRQCLEKTKLSARKLEVGIEVTIKDLAQLKTILEKQQLSEEELLMLKESFYKSMKAAIHAFENYRAMYSDAINTVPFLELSDSIPFS